MTPVEERIDHAEAKRIAEEIRDERGPDRVLLMQRARMWERDPNQWTRYERLLSEYVLALPATESAQPEEKLPNG